MANARNYAGRSANSPRANSDEKVVARNRRASHEYELGDRYEAGIVLVGSEVKAIRAGKVELVDAYAEIRGGEAFLEQLYIAPYSKATVFVPEARRTRKLLLNRREIDDLDDALRGKGATIIPLRLFFRGRHLKVEIAIGKGRNKVDKRQAIAKREADQEARAAIGRARKVYT